jgi:hypothetical protein
MKPLHSRTRYLAVPALALLAFAPAAPTVAVAAAPSIVAWERPATQEDFRWSGRIEAGDWITIKGINGDVHAVSTSGDQVEVVAVKREGRRGNAADVRIDVVTHEDGVTICAVYPAPEDHGPNRCEAGEDSNNSVHNNDTSVEFEVRVPRGVNFRGGTVNGEVSAEDLPADATVSSVNGDVEVTAAGVVEASTVNGSIQAATHRADPGRTLHFSTVNGSITLRVPRDFRARVRASGLNGRVNSDFPLEHEHGRYVGFSAEGEIGSGGRTLRMETVNGSIAIRRADS